MGEGDSPAWVNGSVETLTESVAEEPSHETETARQTAKGIAVGEEEAFAVNLDDAFAVDGFDAYFGWQVVEDPDIVVADEPGHFDAVVDHGCELAEEAGETAGHDIAVLIPVVEDVAQEVEM